MSNLVPVWSLAKQMGHRIIDCKKSVREGCCCCYDVVTATNLGVKFIQVVRAVHQAVKVYTML